MSKALDISGLDSILDILPDFERSLKSENKSPRTIESYVASARLLDTFLAEKGMPRELGRIGREHVETFVVDQQERWKPATAAVRFRSLQQFFKWAESDGEISVSPMLKMKPPRVEPEPVPVIELGDMRTLLKSCEGKERTFDDYRDAALLRLFYDTGCRLSEITMLKIVDVDLEHGEVTVFGKGRRTRRVPFGDATRKALRHYLRARDTHPLADTDWLWLGARAQQLTQSGIAQMLRRRCRVAGIGELHPHQFRHSAAHELLSGGMEESDAMRHFGWRSREMLIRYASSTGEERARDAYRRQGAPGDRL